MQTALQGDESDPTTESLTTSLNTTVGEEKRAGKKSIVSVIHRLFRELGSDISGATRQKMNLTCLCKNESPGEINPRLIFLSEPNFPHPLKLLFAALQAIKGFSSASSSWLFLLFFN